MNKSFEKSNELKAVTHDGLYMYMRELNNTANKKDRDTLRDKNPERLNEIKVKRTSRKRGNITEGKFEILSK